jgi:hypothetical protein
MLPKNLIVRLLVQDLSGWGFGGLLSQTAMHVVAGMGKSRGQCSKRNYGRERERERERTNAHVPDLVGLLV